MKTTKPIYLLLIFFTSLCSISAYANKKDSILLTGKVFNDEERVKGLIVKIYAENDLIKTEHVRSANLFKIYLPKDHYLTIEVSAPNFHTKRFFFDSHLPADKKKMPSYKFDMDIFSEAELENVNTSVLDFPAGLVKYHPKKKVFLRDKKYTKEMKKKYFRLLEEAKLSERGVLEDSK